MSQNFSTYWHHSLPYGPRPNQSFFIFPKRDINLERYLDSEATIVNNKKRHYSLSLASVKKKEKAPATTPPRRRPRRRKSNAAKDKTLCVCVSVK